jgi:hypothetical protein
VSHLHGPGCDHHQHPAQRLPDALLHLAVSAAMALGALACLLWSQS